MPETTSKTRPVTSSETAVAAVVYSDEAWDQLEAQRQQMLNARVEHHFGSLTECINGAHKAEKDIIKAIGNPEDANDRIVLLAAKKAGANGILLSDLRRYIPDPNHLNKARLNLLGGKDASGIPTLPVQVKERRGENNELRVVYSPEEVESK